MKKHNKKIVTYPSPILRKQAEEVKDIKGAKDVINEMKDVLTEADGIGLAAPQIGVSKQIFVVKDRDGFYGFMNPKIIEKSKESITTKEGCLSFPGLWIDVERSKKVKIELTTEDEEKIVIEAEGLGATVFQHEIDHLFGIVFIDHLTFWKKFKTEMYYFFRLKWSSQKN